MAEIIHEIPIKTDAARLYAMLTQEELLSRWWLPGAKIESKEGAVGTFPLSDGENHITIRVQQLIPGQKVVWQCLSHKFPEWTGTHISFEIRNEGPELLLRFQHSDWRDTGGVFGKTSFYWASLYLRSLKLALEPTQA